MQKKSRNSRGKKRAMETHFYTMEFFFSFTRIFLYTFRKIPYNFFLCSVRISRIMNAKISKFEREDKSNGIPLLQHGFFFSFTRIFQNTFRNIPYNFFFMLFSSFQNNYCKNLEIREGRQEQWSSTCTAWIFFFHDNFPMNIQRENNV